MTNETAPERIVNTQTEEAQRVQGSVMASAAHLSTQRFQGWVNPIVASCKDAADMIGALASERDTIQSRLEAAQAEIQRCHERLEITHEFKMRDEHSGLERVEIPYEKRQKKPDGIECRDATIALLEQSNKAAQARIAELEGAVDKELSDRMVAAGMVPLDAITKPNCLTKYEVHAGMTDLPFFMEWLERKTMEYSRMQAAHQTRSYVLDEDIFDFVLGRAAAFKEVLNNYRAALEGKG